MGKATGRGTKGRGQVAQPQGRVVRHAGTKGSTKLSSVKQYDPRRKG